MHRIKHYITVARIMAIALALLCVAPATTHADGPAFVGINGQNLVLNGQRVVLKGANYYPHGTPWDDMWGEWRGTDVQNDFDHAATLGINSLRILVPGPSGATNWLTDQGKINPEYLNELQQIVQLAGQHHMRVILTLFDFTDFPAAGTRDEAADLLYLRTIVPMYANDDRVLAWDLHNEPDNYSSWQAGDVNPAVDWVYRFARATRALDPNHPITVGGGRYDTLFTPDRQGRIIADAVDIISIHNYDAGQVNNQTEWVRKRTNKPILLEETGWPTGPIMADHPNYTEAQQVQTLRADNDAGQRWNVAGTIAWQLYDILPRYILNPVNFSSYYNSYFGLLRANSSPKPAAAVFAQEFAGADLSSATTSALPLTSQATVQLGRPFYFPLTDVQVASPFREYWQRHGGFATFGYPVTNIMYVDGRMVQYFERARFDYYPERAEAAARQNLTPIQRNDLVVDVGPLGPNALAISQRAGTIDPALAATATQAFNAFYAANEGGRILGNGISAPFLETDPETHTVRAVAYYQRAELEYRPELTPAVRLVRVGLLFARLQGYLDAPRGGLPLPAFADPSFARVWRRTDAPVSQSLASRSWIWGPQGFDTTREEYADSPGGMRQVEYFDKTRMEITHPSAVAVDDGITLGVNDGDNAATQGVTNGLLVREMIAGVIQVGDSAGITSTPANIPLAGDPASANPNAPTYASLHNLATLNGSDNHSPDRTTAAVTATLNKDGSIGSVAPALANLVHLTSYTSATGHNIADVFWAYMNNSYGPVYEADAPTASTGKVIDPLFAIGLPITDPYWTRTVVGGVEKDVLVQAFERRILTYTPTNAPAWRVEMGNVGRHYHLWRYGN